MEGFRVGRITQLRRHVNNSARAGYLYIITEIGTNSVNYTCVLPNNGETIRLTFDSDFNGNDRYMAPTSIDYVDIVRGIYELVSLGDGNYGVKQVVNQKVEQKEKVNDKLTFDILKETFKYIPINYDGSEGFYYDGALVIKRNIYNKSKRFKSDKVKKEIKSIKLEPNLVSKFFSEQTLMNNCKFKIKDYRLSSKLFGFTESKKTMVGKVVDVSKIEFQADVKKSDKRENTVYIKVEEKNLRFSLDDIEIIYPNVNGWHERKPRLIKNGVDVKLIRNKEFKHIPKGTIVKVSQFKNVGNKRYIGFKYDNKEVISRINNFKLV